MPILDISLASLNRLDLRLPYLLYKRRHFQNNFSNTYLSETDLSNASFKDLRLTGTKFEDAFINEADLTESTAWFKKCNTIHTSFYGASLVDARFIQASHTRVNFQNAFMRQSQLQSFDCTSCDFRKTDLTGAYLSIYRYNSL
jgi:uncharacterized protein YjbI with pentapeptide repeats